MSKFDLSFKERVVRDYSSGKFGGYRAVGLKHEVSESRVRSWVRACRTHGVLGLKKKFTHYDVDFKLAVLKRMKRDELSYQQTAILFDLRGGTGVVGRWVRQYDLGGARALESKPKGRPPMKRRKTRNPKPKPVYELTKDELVEEVLQLRATVDYLKKLDALMQETKRARAELFLLDETK
jgi:transposase